MAAPGWLKGFASRKKHAVSTTSSTVKPSLADEPSAMLRVSKETSAPDPEAAPEDYMCSSWLEDREPAPGLIPEKMRGTLKEFVKPLKEKMSEALESGLHNPLGESNVGFKLLAKMGFKQGTGLGKEQQGTAAPVEVLVKAGRRGLGVDEEERRREETFKRRRVEDATNLRSDFLARQRAGFEARQVARDLERARTLCEALDTAAGIGRSDLWGEADVGDPAPAADDRHALGCQEHASAGELGGEQVFTTPSGDEYVRRVGGGEEAADPGRLDALSLGPQPAPPLDLGAELSRVAAHMARQHGFCFLCSRRFPSMVLLEAHCVEDPDSDCHPMRVMLAGRSAGEGLGVARGRDLDFDP